MKFENVGKVEKGYIEKTISITPLENGEYEVAAKSIPTGKIKKEEIITMRFTQNGLNALVGSWFILCERKEELR
jgi:hypothetical protein